MFRKLVNKVPAGFKEIKSGEKLLNTEHRKNLIKQIREMVGTTEPVWKDFYLMQLTRAAEMVQDLPASEYHHHAHEGGLLDHLLEVVHLGMSIRRGIENPLTENAEDMVTRRELLSFAIFSACLNHDIGKVVTRHHIAVAERGEVFDYNPYLPLLKQGRYVKYSFAGNEYFNKHESWALSLLPVIIGENGIGWLYTDKDLYSWVMDYFIGGENKLAEVVKKADTTSVSQNMGRGEKGEVINKQGRAALLLMPHIREAVEIGMLALNKAGAGGFVYDEHIYCVESVLIETIIKQFRRKKVDGLPTSHNRILDMLVEYGFAENENGRAIKKYVISSENWPNKTPLSIVRVKLKFLYREKSQWPEFWEGSITADGTESKQERVEPKFDPINKSEPLVHNEQKAATSQPDNGKEPLSNNQEVDSSSVPFSNETEGDTVVTVASWKGGGDEKENFVEKKDDGAELLFNAEEYGKGNDVDGDINLEFIEWLIKSVNEERLTTNKRESPIHITGAGIALLSPKIFRLYSEVVLVDYLKIQAALAKGDTFKKNRKKGSMFKFEIEGKRKNSHITTWLLNDEETKKFKERISVSISINQHLKLIS